VCEKIRLDIEPGVFPSSLTITLFVPLTKVTVLALPNLSNDATALLSLQRIWFSFFLSYQHLANTFVSDSAPSPAGLLRPPPPFGPGTYILLWHVSYWSSSWSLVDLFSLLHNVEGVRGFPSSPFYAKKSTRRVIKLSALP